MCTLAATALISNLWPLPGEGTFNQFGWLEQMKAFVYFHLRLRAGMRITCLVLQRAEAKVGGQDFRGGTSFSHKMPAFNIFIFFRQPPRRDSRSFYAAFSVRRAPSVHYTCHRRDERLRCSTTIKLSFVEEVKLRDVVFNVGARERGARL